LKYWTRSGVRLVLRRLHTYRRRCGRVFDSFAKRWLTGVDGCRVRDRIKITLHGSAQEVDWRIMRLFEGSDRVELEMRPTHFNEHRLVQFRKPRLNALMDEIPKGCPYL
jgi:hypothetical protein